MSDEVKKDETTEAEAKKEAEVKKEEKKEETKKDSFIPLSKQSKLNQKKFHDAKRGTWGNVNPITRTPPSPKAYNRRKTGR